MKKLIVVMALLMMGAWANPWKLEAALTEVPIWPAKSPILAGGIRKLEDPGLLPRDPFTNISIPTYILYAPKKNPSGTCIIIFPGGGYLGLAMGLEGTEIAHWLSKISITLVVPNFL